jgi:hypothetical protein
VSSKGTNELIPEGYLSVGRWIDADFFLPRSQNLPVEVDKGEKPPYPIMATVSGDWRGIKRWRSVTMTKTALAKIKKGDEE